MKKLVFWAMMTLGVISLQSCDKENDNNLLISAGLQEAFDARYPHASRVDWERTGEFYEAEFTENGGEHKAWFTFEGVWVMTEYDIPFTQLPQAVQDAFAAGTYASWRVDDVDKIEKSDMSVVYIIEVESGTQEYELTYLEDGTLIRENTEWSEYLPVAPDQLSSVKELVKEMYPQASILDIEEEKGNIEVEIRDGGRQKEVYFKLTDGKPVWMHTSYEVERYEIKNLPEAVQQALQALSGSGMEVDDIDFFETPQGNYYRVEVEDRDVDKYVYVAENGEMLQMRLKNHV